MQRTDHLGRLTGAIQIVSQDVQLEAEEPLVKEEEEGLGRYQDTDS